MNKSKQYLSHHGILGMHWGVRRYQNEDGTRTEEGTKRNKKKKVLTGLAVTGAIAGLTALTIIGAKVINQQNKTIEDLASSLKHSKKVADDVIKKLDSAKTDNVFLQIDNKKLKETVSKFTAENERLTYSNNKFRRNEGTADKIIRKYLQNGSKKPSTAKEEDIALKLLRKNDSLIDQFYREKQ